MSKKFIIAIDLGGTNLKCALLDNNLRIKARTSFSTKTFNNRFKLITGITEAIKNFISSQGLAKSAILGVGLGLPGPVDTFKGVVHFLPNIPGWKEIGLKIILEKKTKLKVFIDNDAKLMSLAEYKCGAAIGFSNCLCLTLGTGVGGGLIIQNKLYRGNDNAAGEIGHFPLNRFGPLCGCGAYACLETYIGNAKLARDARRLFGAGVTLEKVSALARRDNKKAKQFWKSAGSYLGQALAGAVNLLNLDAIIIGGGVACAGEVLFTSVRQTILKRAMSVQAARVKVLKAKLGLDAGIIGAGCLVKERLTK